MKGFGLFDTESQLHSPDYPGTLSVDYNGLIFCRDSPVSTSERLRLPTLVTTLGRYISQS